VHPSDVVSEVRPEFEVDTRVLDARTLVLALRGGTERAAASMHRSVLAAVRGGRTRLIIDLDGIDDATPGLLGVLLIARRRLLRLGGELVVVSRRSTEPIFHVEGTDDVLARFADLDGARAAVQAP
jgi:anti-anti-sigma regulatory factor